MVGFSCDEEVNDVMRKFEACDFTLEEFRHAYHLAVGMAYLEEGFDVAMERMRTSLQRFSTHHGKMGYHETITRFWLMKLEEIRTRHEGEPLWKLSNLAAEMLGNKDLIFDYYEKEVLMSDEARKHWVAPRVTRT